MYLIQILLPLRDNQGKRIAERHFNQLAQELSEHFGGLTTYARAPADGLWKNKQGSRLHRDEIVIYEVIASRLDRDWWRRRRQALEKTFRQQQILIHAHSVVRL
jgi:hypothetical protein